MRRRLVPAVTILLGSASGGSFTLPKGNESELDVETSDAQDTAGTVDEPVIDHRPALFKLGAEEE